MQLTGDSEQLPVGWTKKKFSEIAILNRGHNPPKSQFIYKPQEGYVRFYQIRDGNNDDYEVYVPDTPQIHKVEPDDILMVAYRHIGRVFRGAKGAFNVALCKITNKNRSIIDDDYLFYIIPTEFVRGELMKQAERSLIPSMSVKHLAEITIPVPPLPEQKRIVTILDEAFEGIDRAIANTEKNLANSRELFESYLNAIFTQKGDEWEEKKLEKLASKIGSGATPRGGQDSYKTEGISLIRSLNVHDRRFKPKDLAFIDDEQAEKLANVVIEEGDVLLNITGASIARSCVVPSEYLPARVNQHVSIIRPDQNQISCHFLNYLITSKPYKDRLLFTGDKAGATRQALTKAQLQDFSVHFPRLGEQELIVKKLDL
jgi:type I restriction enzyme S subunit